MKYFIVESPKKSKQISTFDLGYNFTVIPTKGHILNINPKKEYNITKTNKFTLSWIPTDSYSKFDKLISKFNPHKDELIIATDPDNEGERIANDVAKLFKEKFNLTNFKRIYIYEITENAFKNLKFHNSIDNNLLNACLVRMILDLTIGYGISPLLWQLPLKKNNLSAGRVQSVCLKLISNREEEIKLFKPEISYKIKIKDNDLNENIKFYSSYNEKTLENTKNICEKLLKTKWSEESYIEKIAPKEVFDTIGILSSCSSKLGYSVANIQSTLQDLFEKGLITYPRTDSNKISSEFAKNTFNYLNETVNKEIIVNDLRKSKSKRLNAQESHECIRPTQLSLNPFNFNKLKFTTQAQKIYREIYNRYIGFFLKDEQVKIKKFTTKIDNSNFQFTIYKKEKGGWASYLNTDVNNYKFVDEKTFNNSDTFYNYVKNVNYEIYESKTKPKPKFNESSLIKTMGQLGIGRPSTYGSMLSILKQRQYVDYNLNITSLGVVVNTFIECFFSKTINLDFTSKMEENLNLIKLGESKIYDIFEKMTQVFNKEIEDFKLKKKKDNFDITSTLGEVLSRNKYCKDCKTKLIIRSSSKSKSFFYVCSNCKTYSSIVENNFKNNNKNNAKSSFSKVKNFFKKKNFSLNCKNNNEDS